MKIARLLKLHPSHDDRSLPPRPRRRWPLLAIGGGLGGGGMVVLGGLLSTTSLGWQGWLAIAVTVGAFLLNALTSLAAEAVFLGALAVLMLSGILDTSGADDCDRVTNLMVYGPGGYKFTDFMRVGIPFNLLFWGMTVLLAPRVFPF